MFDAFMKKQWIRELKQRWENARHDLLIRIMKYNANSLNLKGYDLNSMNKSFIQICDGST